MSESACGAAIWLWIGSLGMILLWLGAYSVGRSMGRMEERRAARVDGTGLSAREGGSRSPAEGQDAQ